MADASVNSGVSDAVSVSTSSPSFSEIGEVFHKITDKEFNFLDRVLLSVE